MDYDGFKARWLGSEDADYYTIDLAEDNSFTSIVGSYSSYRLDDIDIEVSSVEGSGQRYFKLYFWWFAF